MSKSAITNRFADYRDSKGELLITDKEFLDLIEYVAKKKREDKERSCKKGGDRGLIRN